MCTVEGREVVGVCWAAPPAAVLSASPVLPRAQEGAGLSKIAAEKPRTRFSWGHPVLPRFVPRRTGKGSSDRRESRIEKAGVGMWAVTPQPHIPPMGSSECSRAAEGGTEGWWQLGTLSLVTAVPLILAKGAKAAVGPGVARAAGL